MSYEKEGNEQKLLTWIDVMEAEKYVYTAGVAGEKFFRALNEKRILGSKCLKCNLIYVPARLYCEKCFSRTEDYEVKSKAYIKTFTRIYVDKNGKALDKPIIIGLIGFEGVEGGILSIIEGDIVSIRSEVEIYKYEIPLWVRIK
jgi:uncharacterized OB-fold protein